MLIAFIMAIPISMIAMGEFPLLLAVISNHCIVTVELHGSGSLVPKMIRATLGT